MELNTLNKEEIYNFISDNLTIKLNHHSINRIITREFNTQDIYDCIDIFIKIYSKLVEDKNVKGNTYKIVFYKKEQKMKLIFRFHFDIKDAIQFTIKLITAINTTFIQPIQDNFKTELIFINMETQDMCNVMYNKRQYSIQIT